MQVCHVHRHLSQVARRSRAARLLSIIASTRCDLTESLRDSREAWPSQPLCELAGFLFLFSSATASLLLRHEHGTIMEDQSELGRLLRSPARRLLRLDGLDAPAPSGTSSAADWNRHTADGIRYKLGSTGAWPTLGSSNTPEAIASARRVGRRRLDAARGNLAPAAEHLVGCWVGGTVYGMIAGLGGRRGGAEMMCMCTCP